MLQLRRKELTRFETEARLEGFLTIAGIDEAGRGPLAGPVVAAACIIPDGLFFPGIDDSKKLSSKQRAKIFSALKATPEVIYGIGIVSVEEIDKRNIYQATIVAMLLAIDNLSIKPDLLLVDGLALPHPSIPARKIIGGDAKSQSIAAASIIAKETRDSLMQGYHEKWPQYGFDRHKGYGTAIHLAALTAHGPCPIHRRTFEPVRILCTS